MKRFFYKVLYYTVYGAMRLWHPVFRVEGRENIPTDGNYLICANHRGMADPLWIIFALKRIRGIPRIMAKESLMKVPLLGALLKAFGVFGVRRGENDVRAVKEGLATLKGGKDLMIFPEGTRVKPGAAVAPKSGPVLLAMRTGTPILPVYIETRRYPFSPMRCVIGRPYLPRAEELRRPAPEELHRESRLLMESIYALGGTP